MSVRFALALLLAVIGFFSAAIYGQTDGGLALFIAASALFAAVTLAWNAGFRDHEEIVSELESRP
jgi:hypothetical protein